MSFKGKKVAGVSALALMYVSSGAHAAEQRSPQPTESVSLAIETVVVTARKREESLQDVPASVNVVSGEALEKRSISNLQELAKYIPNLYVAATPNNPAPYIRGVGSSAATYSFDQTVGTFIDGVYVGRPRAMMAPFFDIDTVEVLRGPQGAILGKNTTAGALNITTRRPTEHAEAGVTLNGNFVGSRGLSTEGYVSGPLADGVAGRLSLQYDGQQGYMKNLVKEVDESRTSNIYVRGQLAYQPVEDLDVLLKVEGGSSNVSGYPVNTEYALITERPKWNFTRETTPTAPDHDRGNMVNANLTANYNIPQFATLTSISSYSFYKYARLQDTDFVAADKYRSHFGERFKRYAQELRLVSPGGERFNWIVGGLIDSTELAVLQASTVIAIPVYNGTQWANYTQTGTSWSIFAQADFEVVDDLKLTLGVRQSSDEKKATLTRSRVGTVLPSWSLVSPLSAKRSEPTFDPTAQIQYNFDPDTMVYASYGRGSKAGGFVSNSHTIVNLSQFEVKGEKVDGYEVGGKFKLFDGRMTLDVAAFDNIFTNLQTSTYEPAPPGCGCYIVGNAGEMSSKGAEIELVWRLSEAFTLQASGAYLEALYDKYPNASCRYNPATQSVPAGFCDLSGQKITNAAKWSGTLGLNMDQPIGEDMFLTGNIILAYRSGTYSSTTMIPAAYNPPGTNVDLRLGIGKANWEVAVLAKNLTDRRVSTNTFQPPLAAAATATTAGQFSGFLDPPRTVGVQLRMTY
ncbi:MAG TPA: TonB-dependent receptor [Rhizomicrobium sp.]|nr:TonB-dependent receptor [Rhizomicrobium sp.]